MTPDTLLMLTGWQAVPTWLTLTWDVILASIRAVLLWGLLFAALGLVAAVGLFFVLRAVKGYRWGWPHAKWFRLATLVFMLIALPLLFAAVGVLQGVYASADRVLTESRRVNSIYSAVGAVGADVIGAAYLLAPRLADAADSLDVGAISLDGLDSFRRGEWEISVPELQARLAAMDDRTLDSIAATVGAEARRRVPALDRGLGKWVLTSSLERVVLPVLKSAVRRKAGGLRVPGVRLPVGGGAFLADLADAARSDGSPETIGRRDLSSHLVRGWIVGPVLLSPFKGLIRAKQLIILVIVGAVVLLPVILFQVAHAVWLSAGRAPAHPASSGG